MNQVLDKIRELSKSREEADFLPNMLGKKYREVIRGDIPLVLFGAGSNGIRLYTALKIHDVNICCFCDNSTEIVGEQIDGLPVISVEELRRKHKDSLILISTSSQYARQTSDQLMALGFSPEMVHIPPLNPMIYYANVTKLYWPPADLEAHAQHLQDAYELFSDAKSRDLFVHRIALFTGAFDFASFRQFIHDYADLLGAPSEDLFTSPRFDENYFYFNSVFFPLKDHEVFANVGALVGECALEFADACKAKGLNYKEIINFEPDPNNYKQILLNTSHLPNMRCLPYGLWSHRDRMRFANPNPLQAGIPGSLSDSGTIEVDVAGMDELLPDVEVTFIKMDVEGAEMEALVGAVNTIRRNRPKLAISLYHKRDDMFAIPLYINSICPDYNFHLRHHCTTFSETVLFAVPK